MNFEEIEKKVLSWAEDRAIFEQSSDLGQLTKLKEEFVELGDALTDSDLEGTIDSIGDMIVVLTMIAGFNGVTLTQCYLYAYIQIKDRRGKMVNGIFVKEQ
jgi:NTP pyrophosphatase (non-canonical NTP hydrolase)